MKEKLLKKFCSDQVCILLERMDSHPEEFVNVYGKPRYYEPRWSSLLNEGAFSKIEKHLLKSKMFGIRRKQTQADIIATLTQEVADEDGPTMSTAGRFSDELSKKMILTKAQMEAIRNIKSSPNIFPTKL
jgi:hypothetical protein